MESFIIPASRRYTM